MSTRYTPWGDRADDVQEPPKRAYGCDREELQKLRALGKEMLAGRGTVANRMKRVAQHLRNVERTTARRAARSLSMRLADVRTAIQHLKDAGRVENDGTIWEESVDAGQRYAAAYRWVGGDE